MRSIFFGLLIIAAVACNNAATMEDQSDSMTQKDSSYESNFPGADEIIGGDTMRSPETQMGDTTKTNK